VAGDTHLGGSEIPTHQPREDSQPLPVTPISGHDPTDLWIWMSWYTRIRLGVPVFLVPLAYFVHLLLGTPFDAPKIIAVSFLTLPITVISLRLLRGWEADPVAHARALEYMASTHTIWDIICTALAVHYAGGAMGPFWPFPFVPVIVASALLPQWRMLALHSAIAIAATALSAWHGGVGRMLSPIALSFMFLGFSAFLTSAVAGRISRQRVARRELDRLRAERDLAEAVARRREEILSVVSHELASPLTTLRGYVRLLREAKGRDRGGSNLLERIDRQVERLSALAGDLLQMASTTAGALQLRRGHLDLVEQLHDAIDGARLQFPEADLRLTGEPTCPGVWDRDRLAQLFSNLISNAMKFAGAKSKVEIEVRCEPGHQVHLLFRDDGPGISPEALRRIFEPFQRYSAERGGGLGLGLAIARSVVELHEGRIWAESPPGGRGATFHVILPTDAKPSGSMAAIDSDPSMPSAQTESL
jgi:signal transduction histidine kinase